MRASLAFTLVCSLAPSAVGQTDLPALDRVDAGVGVLADGQFAESIAGDEEFLLVGASQSQLGLAGEVQLFEWIGGSTFAPTASLAAPVGTSAFGAAVDVEQADGRTLVLVGAPETATLAPNGGYAGLFELLGNELVFVADLTTAATLNSGDRVGAAVALNDGVYAIGRPSELTPGLVYLWRDVGGQLISISSAIAIDDFSADNSFGSSLALDAEVLAVGAPRSGASAAGAVYLFRDNGSVYEPIFPTGFKVEGSGLALGAEFGASVSIQGGLLAVGAPGDGPGSVFLFRQQGDGSFAEEAVLSLPGLDATARFGESVHVSESRVVVGAPGQGTSGQSYSFEETAPGAWAPEFSMVAQAADPQSAVGTAVTQVQGLVVAGAPMADVDGTINAGAAFVHVADESFCLVDLLGSPEISAADQLGAGLSVVGNSAYVGLPLDDGSGTDSGAVAVFERTGVTWDYSTSITVPGLLPLDRLGATIEAREDWVLFGAPGADQGFAAEGRIYLTARDAVTGALGTPQALTYSESELRDQLGSAIDLNSEWIVGGAPGFDGDRGAVVAWKFDPEAGLAEERQVLRSPASSQQAGRFGGAVALGDGLLAVGVPADDDGGPDAGAATLFERVPYALTDAIGYTALDPLFADEVSLPAEDLFGTDGVVALDDLDGDGFIEIAIGSTRGDEFGPLTGGVLVCFTGPGGQILSVVELLQDLADWPELSVGDRFGRSLAWGQFDGDPERELAIGMDGFMQGAGAMYVVDIDSTGAASNPRYTPNFSTVPGVGLMGGALWAHELVNIGDIDENGVDDLAISALNGGTQLGLQGSVRIVRMDTTGFPIASKSIDVSTLGVAIPEFGQFGRSVELIGPSSGGGVLLLVGDSATTAMGVVDPRLYLVQVSSQGDGLLLDTWSASEALAPLPETFLGGNGFDLSGFAWGLAVVGDPDQDGRVEVVVADYLSPIEGASETLVGRFYIFAVSENGGLELCNRFDARDSALVEFGPFARAGSKLELLGDIDGDGRSELYIEAKQGVGIPGFIIADLDDGWMVETPLLQSPLGGPFARFGDAVGLEASTLIVGAPGGDGASSASGAVHVYDTSSGEPVLTQTLTGTGNTTLSRFGSDLELLGRSVVVGAPGWFDGSSPQPTAHLFTRLDATAPFEETVVIHEAGLVAPGDRFGAAVALSEDALLVGAPTADTAGTDSGTVLAYSLQGGCQTILASLDFIALSAGGSQLLELDPGPDFAGLPYWTLASFTPGEVPLGPGVTLPLGLDAVLNLSIAQANGPLFVNTFGFLDADGSAQSSIELPPSLQPTLAGQTLSAAYLVLGLPFFEPILASDAVGLELVNG